jgi:hypothetical protein
MDGRRGLGKDGGGGGGGQGSMAGDYAEREVGRECWGGGGVTDVNDVRVCVRHVTCGYEVCAWIFFVYFFFLFFEMCGCVSRVVMRYDACIVVK